ncbi:hypothetical protein AB0H12_04075 [Actinosynnema sp. NPDC023794]
MRRHVDRAERGLEEADAVRQRPPALGARVGRGELPGPRCGIT